MPRRTDDFYRPLSGITEIDLRKEFNRTAEGFNPEIAKFQPGLLRRFRLNENGLKIKCSCVSPATGEPDRERRCPYCLGEGYEWDEEDITFYHSEVNTESQKSDRQSLRGPGIMNTPLRAFWIQSSYTLTEDDKLVVLVLDKEGELVLPMQRKELYVLAAVTELRLDNGRLEFWKANGYKDNNKHL